MTLLGAKSFNSITAGLSKMVTDLQAFADTEYRNKALKRDEATKLNTEADAHDAEALKAIATAEKISGLLS